MLFISFLQVSFSDTHFGLVTFGNQGIVRFFLNQYYTTQALTAAVTAIAAGQGQTNLYAGLNAARTQVFSLAAGARSGVPQIIIIITDGFANINTDLTIPEANACYQV